MASEQVIPLAALFASIAVITGMLASYLLRKMSPVERRLRSFAGEGPAPASMRDASELDLSHASYGTLEQYARFIPKSPKELSKLQKRLAAAGYQRPEAAIIYGAAEIVLPLLAGFLVFYYLGQPRGLLFGLLAAVVAYMIPGLWIGQRMSDRRRQIENALPDALDLLLVAMEAGSGLDQAMMKVSNELTFAYPILAHEFKTVITDIRAGRPRVEALRHLSDRTKVDDVRLLVMTLIQTDKFGTSVGQALRTHADVTRTKRRQRAEERAQKLGVKLVFPLVFCLFPAMYVVLLGPAALRMMKYFGGG